jgi:cytosine/adenosine deaminase-related metal-dependent hydrolase
MRKISANYIFDGLGNFFKNAILVIDDNEKVVELINTNGDLQEQNKLEFYNGIIVPGFINAHCHLELSH